MTKLIRVSLDTLDCSAEVIRQAGGGGREAAVFWLGRPDALDVEAIVLPVGPEVQWGEFWLRISERWMVRLAETCERQGLVVLGAVHSHPGAAFFSTMDRDAFFHAPDCVSVVLPLYGATTAADARTSWALFVGQSQNGWREGRWDDDVAVGLVTAELVELR